MNVKWRVLLPVALISFSAQSPALAVSWTEFHIDDSAHYAIDSESRRNTPRPRIHVLKSFHQPTPQGDVSAKLLYEADCRSARIRVMNGIYSRNKTADGGVSGMINSNGWALPHSNPLNEKLYALLCDASSSAGRTDAPSGAMGQRMDPPD